MLAQVIIDDRVTTTPDCKGDSVLTSQLGGNFGFNSWFGELAFGGTTTALYGRHAPLFGSV